jgi:hypothetical protein
MAEQVVKPTLDDVNAMLQMNPMAGLQLQVVALSRELRTAHGRIEEMEGRLLACRCLEACPQDPM